MKIIISLRKGIFLRKTTVMIVSICLLTASIVIMTSKENSSAYTLIADAGEDQTVNEGDVVQFNGTALPDPVPPVWPVDISDNGQFMAIGWDKNVTFFNISSNIPLWTYETGGRVGDLKLSENGTYLAVGSYQTVYYFDTTLGTPLWSVNIGDAAVRYDTDPGNRLDMTRDGKYVAAVATGGKVKVYDTTNATPTVPYWDYLFGDVVNVVRFSGDGNYICMCCADYSNLYRLGWVPDKKINWTQCLGARDFYSASLSYNGSRISTAEEGEVELWRNDHWNPIWQEMTNSAHFELAISDDGLYLVSANFDYGAGGIGNGFAFWNTSDSDPLWIYYTSLRSDAVDMDRNANYIVGGSWDNKVYLFSQLCDGSPGWNASDVFPIFNYTTGGIINYNGVSVSADGTYFAAGSYDGNVYLFTTAGEPHLLWKFSTGDLILNKSLLSYKWDFNNYVDSDNDGNFTNDIDATSPTPTHIYGDDGIYTVTLTLEDGEGNITIDTVNVTVNNVAPTIEPFGPFTIDEGEPLILEANTTDPGSDDLTFTWSWGDAGSDNVTTYFNNGITPDPYPSPEINPMNVSDGASHIYNENGSYVITLTVEDDDGGVTIFRTNVTVIGVPKQPPILYINVSQDKRDVILYWDPPPIPDLDHYLIYRSTSQTKFDFNSAWKNTSKDMEPGESAPIPLRTMWNDTNAAFPGNETNYEEQYYYIIRAVNDTYNLGRTSRTVGKWTKTFSEGVSTFSLPLKPIQNITIAQCLIEMNAVYIRWMDPGAHVWMKHGDGCINNTQMKLGEGYEVKFPTQTNFTFKGLPGAMVSYDDSNGFLGFDPATEAKTLEVSIATNGDVNLTWQEPVCMGSGDLYKVFYSNTRDGFFGALGVDYFPVCQPVYFGNNTATHMDALANNSGTKLYYMIVPFNAAGKRGSSTYSIGIWTEEYLSGYDTFGIPLKQKFNETADWYCNNIPDTVGINYYIDSEQRWGWHSKRMSAGAFDPILIITEGYQISTSNNTKFTFIGI